MACRDGGDGCEWDRPRSRDRRRRTLLAEFLPLDHIPSVETARQRTIGVGTRLEKAALGCEKTAGRSPVEAETIALSIDGGHVRSICEYQVRSFEILLAQVTNNEGKQIVFSSVPAKAISQPTELRGVLYTLGATAVTPVTVISDGADCSCNQTSNPQAGCPNELPAAKIKRHGELPHWASRKAPSTGELRTIECALCVPYSDRDQDLPRRGCV